MSKVLVNGKACSKCGITYPFLEESFYKNKSKKDGFRPSCKTCDNNAAILASMIKYLGARNIYE